MMLQPEMLQQGIEQPRVVPRKTLQRRTARLRALASLVLLAFSLDFWWPSLTATFRLTSSNEAFTHILLIVPLSLGLLYLDSRNVRPAIEPTRLPGFFLLAAALVLAVFARWNTAFAPDLRLTLSMLALVLWWIAAVLFLFGWAVVRAFVFPLCFLFWLVPLPDFILNRIISALQYSSAVATRWMFQLARIPVTQNGVFLSLPGGLKIEVAPECSSIRSSMFLLVITMVLAHLFLRSNWRRLLLVVVALPLAVAKNALRIFLIVGLAVRVDPAYLNGDLHHRGGVVFLLIALGVVALLLWALARSEAWVSS